MMSFNKSAKNGDNMITELRAEVKVNRKAEYPIDPIFLNRWSPRAIAMLRN